MDAGALRTIVYVSSATRPWSDGKLDILLLDARAFNRAHGITGVLLFSDGNFMQCLEGAPDAVELAWRRIRASRHHVDLVELLDEPVAARSFPDFLMGYRSVSASTLLATSTGDWRQMIGRPGDASGLALLRGFWANAR